MFRIMALAAWAILLFGCGDSEETVIPENPDPPPAQAEKASSPTGKTIEVPKK